MRTSSKLFGGLGNVALIASVFWCAGGCGGGGSRFDATDEKSANASVSILQAGMTGAQKQQFNGDLMLIAVGQREKGFTRPSELYKPINGLTADQIHAKAQEVRDAKRNTAQGFHK